MITIGTLAWNELEYTKKFVQSLKNIWEPYELLIWDNGSTDDTYKYLLSLSCDEIGGFCRKYIWNHSDMNQGMCVPWNWIMSYSLQNQSHAAVLCNNDIKFTRNFDSIFQLRWKYSEEIGLFCPSILTNPVPYREETEEEIENKAKLYIEGDYYKENDGMEVGGLLGPCMIIPTETIDDVGYFDEELKNSFNDCDYHQRVQKSGRGCVVYHKSVIWHKGGVSTSKNPDCHNKMYYERFQQKHG